MNLCDSYLNLYVLSKTYTDRNIYEKIAKSQRYIIMVYFNIKSFYNQTNVAMHLQIVQKKNIYIYIIVNIAFFQHLQILNIMSTLKGLWIDVSCKHRA